MGKVKIGLVGLGFGRYLFKTDLLRPEGYGHPYFEIGAIADMDKEKADEVGREFGVSKVYYSLDDLLKDPEIPVVGLFSGPVGRASLIRKIIQAGKHVLTTKPFELDPEEGLAVLREARAAGKVVHLNSPSPLLAQDNQTIKEWIEKYKLGRPIAAHFQTWCNYREKETGTWYDDPNLCPVAPIFRLGIYAINDILNFLGSPESVQVVHSHIFTERPTPDNALLSVRFKNGCLASVFASFCVKDKHPYPDTLVLNFENGTVYRNAGPRPEGWKEGDSCVSLSVAERPDNCAETVLIPHSKRSGSYQWENLYRAVRGEKIADEIPAEQIADGVRIIEAMRRAEKSGNTELVK